MRITCLWFLSGKTHKIKLTVHGSVAIPQTDSWFPLYIPHPSLYKCHIQNIPKEQVRAGANSHI